MLIVYLIDDFLTYAPRDGAYAGLARMKIKTNTNTIAEMRKYDAYK